MAVDFLLEDLSKNKFGYIKELDHVKILNAIVVHVYGHGFSIKQNNSRAFVYCLPMHIKNIKAHDEIKILNAKIRNNNIYTSPLSIVEVIRQSRFLNIEEIEKFNTTSSYVNVYGKCKIYDNKVYLCNNRNMYEVKNAFLDVQDDISIYVSDVLFNKERFYAKPFTRFFIKHGDARI